MDVRLNVPCFTSCGLPVVLRRASTSLRLLGAVLFVWFLLQSSSNCQTTSEPVPILTLQADPRKFNPFTPQISYSPTGKFIASWSYVSTGGGFFGFGSSFTESELRIWDAATGKEVVSTTGPFYRIVYSPNEDVVLIAAQSGTIVYSLHDGQEIARLPFSGGDGMCFTPDGQILFTKSVSSGEKVIRNPDGTMQIQKEPRVVTLKAVSTTTWREVPHFIDRIGPLYHGATMSRDARFLVSFVEQDDENTKMKIWDLSSGETLPSPEIGCPGLFEPEFVCNDKVLLIPDIQPFPMDNLLWHIGSGKLLEKREYFYPSVQIFRHLLPHNPSPDVTVDITDTRITLRDPASGKIRTQFSEAPSGRLLSVASLNEFPLNAGSHLLSNNTLVVMSPKSRFGEVRICELESGVQRRMLLPTPVRMMVCSRDGRLFAFQTTSAPDTRISLRNRFEVWNTSESRAIYEATYTERVSAIAMSRDDKLVVAAHGRDVSIIETETATESGRIQLGEHETTESMCFSHDGKLLYTLSGGRLQVWSVAEKRRLHAYEVASGNQLTLSPDGARLAIWSSWSDPRDVSVVDCSNGRLLSRIPCDDDTKAVFFSAEGEPVGIVQEFLMGDTAKYSASKLDLATSTTTKLEGVRSVGYPADAFSNRVAHDEQSGAIAVASVEILKSNPTSTVHVFGAPSGDSVIPTAHDEVSSVAFANNGNSLIMGIVRKEESSLNFVDLTQGKVRLTLTNHRFLVGSRTGKYFATHDSLTNETVLWCGSEMTRIADLPKPVDLRFSPNEDTFATTDKGVVKIWRIPKEPFLPVTTP